MDEDIEYLAAYKRIDEEIRHPGARGGEICRSTKFSLFVLFIAKHTASHRPSAKRAKLSQTHKEGRNTRRLPTTIFVPSPFSLSTKHTTTNTTFTHSH